MLNFLFLGKIDFVVKKFFGFTRGLELNASQEFGLDLEMEDSLWFGIEEE